MPLGENQIDCPITWMAGDQFRDQFIVDGQSRYHCRRTDPHIMSTVSHQVCGKSLMA